MKVMNTKDNKDIKCLEVDWFLRIAVNATFAHVSENELTSENKVIKKVWRESYRSYV